LAVYLQRDGSPATQFNLQTQKFEGVPPLISYIAINLGFVCFLIGLYLTIRFLHQRQFITLITQGTKLDGAEFFNPLESQLFS
jgi:hypothetical protein